MLHSYVVAAGTESGFRHLEKPQWAVPGANCGMYNQFVRSIATQLIRIIHRGFCMNTTPTIFIECTANRINNRIPSTYIDVETVLDVLQGPPKNDILEVPCIGGEHD